MGILFLRGVYPGTRAHTYQMNEQIHQISQFNPVAQDKMDRERLESNKIN